MEPSLEEIEKILKEKSIRLSYQRLKVLEYLAHNQHHPTVDEIFTDLVRSIPTLSKTTVYNTLKTLVEAGLTRLITIEDNETRYDIVVENHGHFKCECCGEIYNFAVDMDALASEELKDFKINDKNLYFKGICPKCLSNINNK